jgi:hypothetical protein
MKQHQTHTGNSVSIDANGNVVITFVPPSPGSTAFLGVTTDANSLAVNGQSISLNPGITDLPGGVVVDVVGLGHNIDQITVT